MPIVAEEYSSMVSEARSYLIRNTDWTNFQADSLVWAITVTPLQALSRYWSALSDADGQRFIHTATGTNLSLIGEMLGLYRKSYQAAHTLSQTSGFKFYVPNGQTYSAAGGSGIATIPTNTRVWCSRDPGKIYRTTQDATFISSTKEVFVPIVAEGSGSYYNTGPGQIDKHDSIQHQTWISCTNLHAIDTGTDLEDDDSFRYRLSQQIYRLSGRSGKGLRATLLDIPGVRDVYLWEYARGTGTIDAVILTFLPQVSEEILTRCREEAELAKPEGISVTVKGPIERAISLEIRLTPEPTTDLITYASSAITWYINNLSLGESFIINELIQRVMETSEEIVDMELVSMTVQNRFAQSIPSLRVNQVAQPDEKFYAGTVTVY